MLKISRCAFIVGMLALAVLPAHAGEVKLTMNNGLVTVVATDVPVSQILAEWARIGQTKIVNGEKLMTMVNLELVDVPEKKALEIVLRSASGFMVAERKDAVAGTSAFDRIMILPFSQAPAFTPSPMSQSMPQPFVNRPVMATPEFEDANQPVPVGQQPQQPVNMPQTLPMPGMMPQPTGPGGQQPPTTLPRPGFLPQPLPPKPPGGGGGQNQ
jgi:hypothetical protein